MYHQLVASRNQTIIEMYNLGLSKTFIAEQFGMKKAQVAFIIRRGR